MKYNIAGLNLYKYNRELMINIKIEAAPDTRFYLWQETLRQIEITAGLKLIQSVSANLCNLY